MPEVVLIQKSAKKSEIENESFEPIQECCVLAEVCGGIDGKITPSFEKPLEDIAPSDSLIEDSISSTDYFSLDVDEKNIKEFLPLLLSSSSVENVYVMPNAEFAVTPELNQKFVPGEEVYEDKLPRGDPQAPEESWTANCFEYPYKQLQAYLNDGPEGIGATYAWNFQKGPIDYQRVKVVDIEGDWRENHEDLKSRSITFLGGHRTNKGSDIEHGTATLAMIGAIHNDTGIHGIAPDSELYISSTGYNSSHATEWRKHRQIHNAIVRATDELSPGDIMLIEQHAPGPRFGFRDVWTDKTSSKISQEGYIAVEYWPLVWRAVRNAVSKGIIVVSAAGNGSEYLDDNIYSRAPYWDSSSSTRWVNPFMRSQPGADSGSIIVGAGSPPSGVYGQDRSALIFSNYGSCIDCQGWGEQVVTAGYGGLQKGHFPNLWYTGNYSGTSSASAMVAGVLACLQGIIKSYGHTMTPDLARKLLRATGHPQQHYARNQRGPIRKNIGNRPDLKQLIDKAFFELGISHQYPTE